MDWNKWRKEEDERLQDFQRVQELRKIWGLENRPKFAFWFDVVTSTTIIIVSIALIFVCLPWIVELYKNDPMLWPRVYEQLKHLAVPLISACLAIVAIAALVIAKK
jgi:hypothetical protein